MSIMNDYIIRDALDSDYDKLCALFDQMFGRSMCDESAYDPIEGRYKVALDRFGDIVATTGLIPPSRSSCEGYEVTWTATLPAHRKRGLVTHMLADAINQWAYPNIPIYCFCWRVGNNEKINLYSVLTRLGFTEVMRGVKAMSNPHFTSCKNCPYSEHGCYCYNDLWVLERF